MLAVERLRRLVDGGSFCDIEGLPVDFEKADPETVRFGDGVLAGEALVGGSRTVVFAQEKTFRGGSMGAKHLERLEKVVRRAIELRVPVLGLFDSGGARVNAGMAPLVEPAALIQGIMGAKGVVPLIFAAMGTVTGGAAYACSAGDVVVMVRGSGRMFIWGPGVARAEFGTEVTMERLGGAALHVKNGQATHVAGDESGALNLMKKVLGYFERA